MLTGLALGSFVFLAGDILAQGSGPDLQESRRLDSLEMAKSEQRAQTTSDANTLSDLKSKKKDSKQVAKDAQRVETDASNSAKASKRAYKNERKAQKSRRQANSDAKKAADAKLKVEGNH